MEKLAQFYRHYRSAFVSSNRIPISISRRMLKYIKNYLPKFWSFYPPSWSGWSSRAAMKVYISANIHRKSAKLLYLYSFFCLIRISFTGRRNKKSETYWSLPWLWKRNWGGSGKYRLPYGVKPPTSKIYTSQSEAKFKLSKRVADNFKSYILISWAFPAGKRIFSPPIIYYFFISCL